MHVKLKTQIWNLFFMFKKIYDNLFEDKFQCPLIQMIQMSYIFPLAL